jgi:Domain of unknown function (DUF6431)
MGSQKESMLSVKGLSCKVYWEFEGVPKVFCPNPDCEGALLRSRGWYWRYVDGEYARIRRLRCPRCAVSHALLPDDLCAYRDARLGEVERALEAGSPSLGAEAAGQAGSVGVRRVRRWLRAAAGPLGEKIKALLPAVGGSWWQRAQAVVGEGAGWLCRLRHWLWSSASRFLGGLSGLYRQGRPGFSVAAGRTTVW